MLHRRFIVGVLAAALALGVVAAASARPHKLVANGGFESALAGWRGYNASLATVSPGKSGRRAARVTARPGADGMSIYPARPNVAATAAGAAYEARAAVRSRSGARVCLKVRESSGRAVVGSAESCVRAGRSWRRLPVVSYTARHTGNSLDVYVHVWQPRARATFDVDSIRLVLVRQPSDGSAPDPEPAPSAPAGLAATGTDHAHIRLSWPAAAGAARYRIWRGDVFLSEVDGTTLTDNLLWPSTRYAYTVEALGADGAVLSREHAEASTRPLPATGFPRPFAPSSFWNTPVGSAPSHPRSADLISYVASHARNPNMPLRAWGVAVAEVREGDRAQAVPCTRYRCTLDAFGGIPMPATAKADPAGDGHLAVVDPAAQREWGMWQATNAGGSWSASAGAAVSIAGDGVAPPKIGSGNAANFPMLGGIIRPEEILQGRIDHALVFGLPGIAGGAPVCPATHNAGTTSDPNALREGMRLQLDPSLNVDSLPVPAWQKVVMRAMQEYGMYLRDNSGSLAVYAENPISRGYDAWSLVGMPSGGSASLAGIPWDRFRVLDAPDC